MSAETSSVLAASFRDPSGQVFSEGGVLYRSVSPTYKTHYDALLASGLYQQLIDEKLLVAHTEVAKPAVAGAYKVLQPERLPFISYPYEWSFSQLQDAALATLRIQQLALNKGMTLKDATAYNMQFHQGKPILIDTLSFEVYEEGKPWIAYRQFCQHFLAPLALIAHLDLRLGTLSRNYIDGVPLDLASKLLPGKTRFSVGLAAHIHLHARSQVNHANDAASVSKAAVKTGVLPKSSQEALLANLEATTRGLHLPKQKTEWGDYYTDTNYTPAGHEHKAKVIKDWIAKAKPASVWDAGANDGTFSRLASSQGIRTVASDIDSLAIEKAYLQAKAENDINILPLVIDLTNPSPGLGWANEERDRYLDRAKFDLTLVLAFIHHLSLSNNLPLGHLAKVLHRQTKQLIIEFVPKGDSNADRLLATREDIFPDYTEAGFEAAFAPHFSIKEKAKVKDSLRTLYLMERK